MGVQGMPDLVYKTQAGQTDVLEIVFIASKYAANICTGQGGGDEFADSGGSAGCADRGSMEAGVGANAGPCRHTFKMPISN